MYQNLTFKVPNDIITEPSLQLSSRVLLITLYSCCNRFRVIEKPVHSIAGLAGLSTRCVLNGLKALETAGYIRKTVHKRYNRLSNRVVNDVNSYYLIRDVKHNYTKLPRAMFDNKDGLTAADFCTVAYLHMLGAKARRAFPSKAKIAAALGIAKSTVAITLAKISANLISTLLLHHCRRRRGDFAANSYHIVKTQAQDSLAQNPKDRIPTVRAIRMVLHRSRRRFRRTACRICKPIIASTDYQGQFCLCLDTNYYNRQRRKRQYKRSSKGCPIFAQQELQT